MRTHNTTPERFWSKVLMSTPDACWEWKGMRQHSGHGRISWNGRLEAAHRIAWMFTYGPIPEGKVIRHSCDNPPCCNPAHLLIGTQLDNIADRVARGRTRSAKGEANPGAKLTQSDVDFIREQYATERMNQTQLARKFGVALHTVWGIIRNTHWRSDAYTYVPRKNYVTQHRKVSRDARREIRNRYAQGGISYSQLAREYGVTAGCIFQIMHSDY